MSDAVGQFIDQYYGYAEKVDVEWSVPALFSLGQSAYETGWGKSVSGNMMFGVKDTDGVNGNEQLLVTTEYHSSPTVKYPFVYAIREVKRGRLWKYKVKDWFRKYPSPYESFRDHALFLRNNPRYQKAFNHTMSAYAFASDVCDAGYATDPHYKKTLFDVMRMIEKRL